MVRAMLEQSSKDAPSSLAALRQRPDNTLSPSVSWVPSRTTLNVPARRSSTAVPLTDPAGPDLPTCTSYRRRSRRASGGSAATRVVAGLSGLCRGQRGLTVAPDEPAQDRRRPADVAAGGSRLDLVGLVGFEVAGVLVDLDPGAQAGHVELGVELGRVDVAAEPERLHRAASRTGQQDGPAGLAACGGPAGLAACGGGPRQVADRLLVAGEGLKGRGQLAEQRIPPPAGVSVISTAPTGSAKRRSTTAPR